MDYVWPSEVFSIPFTSLIKNFKHRSRELEKDWFDIFVN